MVKVGHTHNRLDQRFSSIAFYLRRAPSFQSPAEYVAYLQQHYQPARGVKLIVEEVHGVHDWRGFFSPLNVRYMGITGTKSSADAAHCLRVVRRDMVKPLLPDIVDFEEQGHGADPVLLAKHWLCSKSLSQQPTVLLRGKLPVELAKLQEFIAPRSELNEESLKKYTATAKEVLAAPWSMEVAFAYLTNWMERNKAGERGAPPCIDFILDGRDFLPQHSIEADLMATEKSWKDFAPLGAIEIRPVPVSKAKAKAALKRPAASSAQAPQFAWVSRRSLAERSVAVEMAENGLDVNGQNEAASDPPCPGPVVTPEVELDAVEPEDGPGTEAVEEPEPLVLRRPPRHGARRPAAAVPEADAGDAATSGSTCSFGGHKDPSDSRQV